MRRATRRRPRTSGEQLPSPAQRVCRVAAQKQPSPGWQRNTTYTVSVVATGNTANYESSTAATLSQATSANSVPTVANAIPDQAATTGTAFSFTLPAGTFSDADSGDSLTYTAQQTDGTTDSALPTWLSFTAGTGVFSGTPTSTDTGTLSVKVTASDGTASVSDTFDIVVSAADTAPAFARQHDHRRQDLHGGYRDNRLHPAGGDRR